MHSKSSISSLMTLTSCASAPCCWLRCCMVTGRNVCNLIPPPGSHATYVCARQSCYVCTYIRTHVKASDRSSRHTTLSWRNRYLHWCNAIPNCIRMYVPTCNGTSVQIYGKRSTDGSPWYARSMQCHQYAMSISVCVMHPHMYVISCPYDVAA